MPPQQQQQQQQTLPRPQSQQQALNQSLPPLQTQIPPPGTMGRAGTFDTTSSMGQNSPYQAYIPPTIPAAQRSSSGLGGHERSYSHGAMLNQPNMQSQPTNNARNSTQALSMQQPRFNGNTNTSLSHSGPPQLGALPFQTQQSRAQSPAQGSSNIFSGPPSQPQELPAHTGSPARTYPSPSAGGKQVFGVSLARLYERDQFAVPMVVHQCIQAVDLYGLAVEGIYRLSGSAMHVNKLKNLFDTGIFAFRFLFPRPANSLCLQTKNPTS